MKNYTLCRLTTIQDNLLRVADLANDLLSDEIVRVEGEVFDEGQVTEYLFVDVLQVLSFQRQRQALQHLVLFFEIELVLHQKGLLYVVVDLALEFLLHVVGLRHQLECLEIPSFF